MYIFPSKVGECQWVFLLSFIHSVSLLVNEYIACIATNSKMRFIFLYLYKVCKLLNYWVKEREGELELRWSSVCSKTVQFPPDSLKMCFSCALVVFYERFGLFIIIIIIIFSIAYCVKNILTIVINLCLVI